MAKHKTSNKKVKKDSTKREPINTRSIWHIVVGILALIAIIAIIILAIPKESPDHRVIPVVPEETVDIEDQTDTTPKTETKEPSVPTVVDKKKSTGGGSSGGSSGSSDSSSGDATEPAEAALKCANWFGNNLNWEEITVATKIGNSGPWGLMNNNECTEAIIGEQGVYACALYLEGQGYAACAGDCKEGDCLPCPDCKETIGEDSCADTIDNDGDGTIDCLDEDCEAKLCAQNSYCQNNECVEEEAQVCSYVDTDGGNDHFVQGTCDDGKAIVYTDYCQDEDILIEYWLGEGEACYDGCQGGSTLFYCPSLGNGWSCDNGACALAEGACEFTDSDGGWNLEVQGTCDDGKAIVYTDSCSDYRSITEYRLHPSEPCAEGCAPNSYTCSVLCEDGACVPETKKTENLECSDYCQARRSPSYETGVCVDYNAMGAVGPEQTCSGNGYLTYETGSEGNCGAENICCCVTELLIQ
jgi:hypothetical protein